MNKTILKIISLFTLLFAVGCQPDNYTFGSIETPTNIIVTAEVVGKTDAFPNGDGSGKVKFTAKADNAIAYKFVFPDGSSKTEASGNYEKLFSKVGLNTYTVVIIASGKGGVSSSTTIDVTVLSNFEDPEAVQFLTGGTSKKWYWAQNEVGHLGVGQNSAKEVDENNHLNYAPTYYGAQANEKANTCLYNSNLTFALVGEQLKMTLDNGGQTFYNGAIKGGDDACYELNTAGAKNVSLSPSESFVSKNPNAATQTRKTMLNIADGGFMGYFFGASSYEILSITANRMVVRAVMPSNPALAWYHTFTTTPPGGIPPTDDYTNLVWSDEFNTDGAPNAAKWTYDLGAGGWGNNEEQTYTNNAANATVLGGSLKITAIKNGSSYTSARLKTQGIYDFKYGKVEVKAKLPEGGGTWPAIWMLGNDFNGNNWPDCGEIDIMEHRGNSPNVIHGTLHYPGNSGGNANTATKTISNASTAFHVYKVIWNSATIKFYVDDVLFHTFANSNSVPFNKNFFLILNVAMGGTFGGAISPTFVQSAMEVDYVRVYQ
jgi:beta-glucanase (GH16 family)